MSIHYCPACRELQRNYYKDYYHTLDGFLKTNYRAIKRRVKVQPAYKNRKVTFTFLEYYHFCINNDGFNNLWKQFIESNFDRKFVPTLDRINNDGDYSLDNIQFLTLSDNVKKDYHKSEHHPSTKIYCLELDKEYKSMTEASNELSIPLTSIYYASINGKLTRGYHFKIIK